MDEFLNHFPDLIQYIYKEKRKSGSILTKNTMDKFPLVVSHFENFCPTLSKRFHPDLPLFLYVKKIIEFALEGLGDTVLNLLWNCTNDIPAISGYKPATVQQYSQGFGLRIAEYLLEKNLELGGLNMTPKANPLTLRQYLIQSFGLSYGEINVLLAYCTSENKGRKIIANELGLSENTIKTHTRSIMKKMKTKTINDAVSIVKAFKP